MAAEKTNANVAELNEKVDELSKKVNDLNVKVSKLENIDAKIDKIQDNSEKISAASEKLLAADSHQKVMEIVKGQMYSPSGFLANELTKYIMATLQRLNTTNFRRWLITVGGNIVKKSIESYIVQKVPLINWYDTKVTDLGDDKYHYTSKGSFPVSINTGVPFVGRIELTKVTLEINADIDNKTKQTTNQKLNFSSDKESKRIFAMFVEDLDNSLKPHETAYKILRPFGMGITKLYKLLASELTFSIPLLVLFVVTLIVPYIPPALPWILPMVKITPSYWPWIPYTGLNTSYLIAGLLNGMIYGLVIWATLRYHLIGHASNFIIKASAFVKKNNKLLAAELSLAIPITFLLILALVIPSVPMLAWAPRQLIGVNELMIGTPHIGVNALYASIVLNGVIYVIIILTFTRYQIIGYLVKLADKTRKVKNKSTT